MAEQNDVITRNHSGKRKLEAMVFSASISFSIYDLCEHRQKHWKEVAYELDFEHLWWNNKQMLERVF